MDAPQQLQEMIDVVAAVIVRDGRYLICQRPVEKAHGGLWEFPGGKVHFGETLMQAVKRELAEELAIDQVSCGTELYQGAEPGSRYRIRFIEALIEGDPSLLEHAQLAWVSPSQLQDYPLAPVDRQFAKFVSTR
jgi:mutator protein MutT